MHNTSGTSFVRMPVEILTKMHPTDGVSFETASGRRTATSQGSSLSIGYMEEVEVVFEGA